VTPRKKLTPHQRLAVGADWLRRKATTGRGFHMGHWYTTLPGRIPHLRDLGHDCDTMACAAGWMALCPALQAEGLGLAVNTYALDQYTPSFGPHRSWNALEKFFGLTTLQVCQIFDPSTYPEDTSVRIVVARIEKVLAELDKASNRRVSSNKEAHDAV
jgi:hypothetical protein